MGLLGLVHGSIGMRGGAGFACDKSWYHSGNDNAISGKVAKVSQLTSLYARRIGVMMKKRIKM